MKRSFHNGNYDLDVEPNQQKRIQMERIRNAKKNRILQLKKWSQYDKVKEKEEYSRLKKGLPLSRKGQKSVRFQQNLILLEAGSHGDTEEMRRLLSAGVCADVANTDGLTALHQCAINNNVDMCHLLINYKANVNAKDKEMWTPLHTAAVYGHTDICLLLIRSGADLLAVNNEGNMPYDICKHEVTLDAIENEMEAQGITQDDINETRMVPERLMMHDLQNVVAKKGIQSALLTFSQLDKQGANVLHVAAACGYSEVTLYLIKLSMPLDAVDKDGWQATHIAALFNQLAIIEILVLHGADIEAQTKQGETVFELVCDKDMYERLSSLKGEIETKKDNRIRISSLGLVKKSSSINPRSASIRRTSMKDKSFLSWKEARQEAELRLAGVESDPTKSDGRNAVSRTIAEVEVEDACTEAMVRTRVHSGAGNHADLRDSFTHSHPYNSPTRDPDTFPYDPRKSSSLSRNVNSPSSSRPASDGSPVPLPRVRTTEKTTARTNGTTGSSRRSSSQESVTPLPPSLDLATISSRPPSGTPRVAHQLPLPGHRRASSSSPKSTSTHTTPIGSTRISSQSSPHPRSPRPTTTTNKQIAARYRHSPKLNSCCEIM